MDAIANPVFDSSVTGNLIQSGHVWIGVGLVLLQLVLIPSISRLFKHYVSQSKQVIDAERMVTKLERDNQMQIINSRMDKIEIKHETDYNSMSAQINDIKKMMDRFDVKLDRVFEKLDAKANL